RRSGPRTQNAFAAAGLLLKGKCADAAVRPVTRCEVAEIRRIAPSLRGASGIEAEALTRGSNASAGAAPRDENERLEPCGTLPARLGRGRFFAQQPVETSPMQAEVALWW